MNIKDKLGAVLKKEYKCSAYLIRYDNSTNMYNCLMIDGRSLIVYFNIETTFCIPYPMNIEKTDRIESFLKDLYVLVYGQ